MIELSKERWYAFCDGHKQRLESKNIFGRFAPIEDPERCEWKRELMQDKRTHKCKEEATWEYYAGIRDL